MCEQNLWTLQQKPDCIFLTMRILYQLLGALEIWATFCPYPHPHHKGKNGIFTYSHSTQIRDNIPCCAAVSYWYSCIVKKEPAETNRDWYNGETVPKPKCLAHFHLLGFLTIIYSNRQGLEKFVPAESWFLSPLSVGVCLKKSVNPLPNI